MDSEKTANKKQEEIEQTKEEIEQLKEETEQLKEEKIKAFLRIAYYKKEKENYKKLTEFYEKLQTFWVEYKDIFYKIASRDRPEEPNQKENPEVIVRVANKLKSLIKEAEELQLIKQENLDKLYNLRDMFNQYFAINESLLKDLEIETEKRAHPDTSAENKQGVGFNLVDNYFSCEENFQQAISDTSFDFYNDTPNILNNSSEISEATSTSSPRRGYIYEQYLDHSSDIDTFGDLPSNSGGSIE